MFELNSIEIATVKAVLDGCDTSKKISDIINRSHTRTTVIVQGLCDKGLLERKRRGIGYVIEPSSQEFMNPLKSILNKYPRVLECITGSQLTLLSYVTGPARVLQKKDLRFKTGSSDRTIRLFISKAIRYGVLRKADNSFELSDSMGLLREFVNGYCTYASNQTLRCISRDAIIHWRSGFEFIFSAPKKQYNNPASQTGITAFRQNGVEIIAQRKYFHFTPNDIGLTIEDHVLDNILVDLKNRTNILYSLIYLKKHRKRMDTDRLKTLARIYGFDKMTEDMLLFIDGQDVDEPLFPSPGEFIEKYRIYGD